MLFICENYEKFNFFLRFVSIAKTNGFTPVFLTDKIGIKLKCVYLNIPCYLNKKITNRDYRKSKDIHLVDSIECILGLINLDEAEKYYTSIYDTLEYIWSIHKFKVIFIWNGSGVQGYAANVFSNFMSIPIAYMEISNLPGKIFVDKDGVNARSSLYLDLNVLHKYPDVTQSEFSEWLSNFKDYKLKNVVPQSKNIKKFNYSTMFDYCFSKLTGRPVANETKFIKRYTQKMKTKNIFIAESDFDYSVKYIFLGLQVCSDTQILLNSDVNNEGALDLAIMESEKINLPLVVKIHPAEMDKKFIDSVIEKSIAHGFYISKQSSTYLIENAEKIITINSTIGLEAKIFNKDLLVLGRAIYKNMTNDMLQKFIIHHLINVDYFSSIEVSQENLEHILNVIDFRNTHKIK